MTAFAQVTEQYRPRTSHVEFLKAMEAKGAPLAPDEVDILVDAGLIRKEDAKARKEMSAEVMVFADLDRYVLDTSMYLQRCADAGMDLPDEITKEDWDCREPAEFDKEFVAFILSHYKRFCDLKAYRPLYAYITQCERWLAGEVPDLSRMDPWERFQWIRGEDYRYGQNSMYALCRQLKYKDPTEPEGKGTYKPTLAMYFICFLIDQRRGLIIGKGRQIFSTTTITGIAALRTARNPNYFTKFIACDGDTTNEIMEDKLKFAYSEFQPWVRAKIINDPDGALRVTFRPSAGKGVKKAATSKVAVSVPKASAINGGSPDFIPIDEAPFLKGELFQDMLKEGRPALFKPIDGKLLMRRQLLAWGTGGRSIEGGGSFEKYHRMLFDQWIAGDYSEGFVPIFLDWTCRAGATVEFYREELARVMSIQPGMGATEMDRDKAIVQFRQTMPSSLDDMYAVNTDTLVSSSFIIAGQDRCERLPANMRGQWGRFHPIFDHAQKMPPDSFFPFKVSGVEWVPAPDGEVNAPVFMWMRPQKGWTGRYFQGTDPITHATGLSMHASAIWDAHYRTIPCIVNTRTHDPYDAYAQSKLMGMYYANNGEQFCPELIENNIGKTYVKWVCGPEWGALQSMLTNRRLMDILQGGGEDIGWDSKGTRKGVMVTAIGKNMLLSHGKNIYIPVLWSQLRFFVGVQGSGGNILWGVDDRKKHQDDVIDAAFMAYACRMSFQHVQPVCVEGDGVARGSDPITYKTIWHNGVNMKVPDITPRKQAAA